MDDSRNLLASYVPPLLGRLLIVGTQVESPQTMQGHSAILFADISGFTDLTERLTLKGPAGIEELTQLLNTCFGGVVDLVSDHGGEVIRFAGDALLARWPAPGDDLAEAVGRAATCSLLVREHLDQRDVGTGVHVSMRMAIGAGLVQAGRVGGVRKRWEIFLTGPPLRQIARTMKDLPQGGVGLSPEAWLWARDHSIGSELPRGSFLLRGQQVSLPARRLDPTVYTDTDMLGLRLCIPMAIRARLEARQEYWLAERRRVSVLFVRISDLEGEGEGWLERAQQATRAVQEGLYEYGGSLDKILSDDKGTLIVAVFGLPPMTTEGRASRAICSALRIQERLWGLGLECSSGVASGRVFCGPVGNDTRREYTVIGATVNLAARLMQHASGDIQCDVATWRAAREEVAFEALPPFFPSGMSKEVVPYRAHGLLPRRRIVTIDEQRLPLVGRGREMDAITDFLEALRTGESGVLFLEGEPGIGKSRLLEEVVFRSRHLGIRVLHGKAEAIALSTPYHAWQRVFQDLLGLDGQEDRVQAARHLAERLPPEQARMAPLLSGVLALDLHDNDATIVLQGNARAEKTRQLLTHLLHQAAHEGNVLLVLEDGHWFDSATWALLLEVVVQVKPLAILVITRPVLSQVPFEMGRIKELPGSDTLLVKALPAESIESLLASSLGVSRVPADLAAWIHQKAEGNAFFCLELARSLQEQNLLVIEEGRVESAPSRADLNKLPIPDNVEGTVTARINTLEPAEQLVLKIAAVLGPVFTLRDLRAVYPVEQDRISLGGHVAHLVEADLLLTVGDADTWAFRHQVTLDVAYDMMLSRQRLILHEAVASWIQTREADNLAPCYPVLAHHWILAEMPSQAFTYLEKAGNEALRSGVHQEAAAFFGKALELADRWPVADDLVAASLRVARWKRCLGDACYAIGRMEDSRTQSIQALDLLGHPMPVRLPAQILCLARLVFLDLRVAMGLGPRLTQSRPDIAEAAQAAERLSERYFFLNDILPMLLASLHAAGLAERSGPAFRVGRTYGLLGLAMGLARMEPIANWCFNRGRALADAVSDTNGIGFELQMRGLCLLGFGRWAEAQDVLRRSIAAFELLADQQELRIGRTLLALSFYFTGHFEESRAMFGDILASARKGANDQHASWGLYASGECLLPQGRTAEALALIDEGLDVLARVSDRPSEILSHSLAAVASYRLGDRARARREADVTLDLVIHGLPTVFSQLDAYAGVVDVYTRLWEDAMAGPDAGSAEAGREISDLARRVRQASQRMLAFTVFFPIGLPRLALLWGRIQRIRGHRRLARFVFMRGLESARRLGMPYEEALASLELGRPCNGGGGDEVFLKDAARLFGRLGCKELLREVEDLLGPAPRA